MHVPAERDAAGTPAELAAIRTYIDANPARWWARQTEEPMMGGPFDFLRLASGD